jgi:hypothetical protein
MICATNRMINGTEVTRSLFCTGLSPFGLLQTG